MIEQIQKANLLKNLHVKGDPLILYNIWDAGSARALQEIGAKAITTSSWSVAAAHGYDDGEKLPFDLALGNIKRIIQNINIPVTIDLEGGYSKTLTQLCDKVKKIIEIGVVGINIEDQIIGSDDLYPLEEQSKRIKAIRQVATQTSIPIFINARTDIFLKKNHHDESNIENAIQRCFAYAESGANGFFVPGLKETKYIERLCEFSSLPVNIMMLPDMLSPKQLAELGVARISYGPSPYFHMIETLKKEALNVFSII